MMKGVYAAAFCIAALCVAAACCAPAQASPFCPADIAFMTPWNFETDAPAAGDASAHYAYRLEDDGHDVLSGHITLAGDTTTYTLAFSDVHFADANRPASDPDPIGDEYEAPGAFVTLTTPAAIRYAWVSDVTDPAGTTTKCPIFPYKLTALTNEDRARMTSAPPPKGVHIMYADVPAQAAGTLPRASCPNPYRDAMPDGDPPKYTRFFDPTISGRPVVQGAAAVDASGKVIATAVLKPSGSQVYDNAAKEEMALQKFIPALFDCQPAAGIYYFAREYYYQK